MYYFTADSHFGHLNILKYCKRPFKTVEEMDETIISNWNMVITKNDIVYHLGDFSFQDPLKYLNRLNGRINLVIGNHDYKRINSNIIRQFESVCDLKEIIINNQTIVLCHYAMRVWPKSHFNSWHLYGHSHGGVPSHGKSFDVGVDCNNFTPLSFNQVEEKMLTLENNFNWIGENER